MLLEEIARKLSKYSYEEIGDAGPLYYSYDNYWEKNKRYFFIQAEIYLSVKERLETKKGAIPTG